MSYRPSGAFTTPLVLLTPTKKTVSGVTSKIYPTIEEAIEDPNNIFYGTFKTYGGTEKVINGIYSIEKTAVIESWYRPDIKADCRIGLIDKGKIYDIYADIEDIEERHQFMKFKVKYYGGGA